MVAPFEFLYPIIHKFKIAEYVPTASDKAQMIDSGEILDEPSFETSVETDEKAHKSATKRRTPCPFMCKAVAR
ncbi:hypothetical protein BK654_26660 [Pseudomonas brassicacearum]|uniref:hypothetical protein n=1 Tax=Pseudomonas brassicacearum TaxID=930166 RepID=UPI000F4AF396|nr:hypothetical protein [Pseudomonas brassicacearum]ROM72487.1 hypothetical protein BK654_26660 [Pseudomonas brassicacearum]